MKNNNNYLEKRKILLDQIVNLGPFIEGSLSRSERCCGSTGCVCHRGKKHQVMYFTWKEDQVTKSVYVPVAKWDHAEECNKNYKKLKILIAKLSDLEKAALKS